MKRYYRHSATILLFAATVAGILTFLPSAQAAIPLLPLEGTRLTDGWLFVKGDSKAGENTPPKTGWISVSVPHTWNADRKPGKEFQRGSGWYKRTVDLPDLSNGQRAYLRFEAVGTIADVYFNGRHLGRHADAFNAFTFEITPYARPGKANELVVRADNSFFPEIIPLQGAGVSVNGGIYRPVHLIIKPATSFSLLDHGSYGVAIDQVSVTEQRATLRITTTVDTGVSGGARTKVALSLKDASGKLLATASSDAQVRHGAPAIVAQEISVDNPRLWQGIDDPYLHTLLVELRDAANGALLDSQEWPVGFRWFEIDPKRGFFLNGKPYKIRGANRYQDRPNKGWALSDDDHAEDVDFFCEMGANAVRLTVYPQSDIFHALCDRVGLLVWAEIPFMKTYIPFMKTHGDPHPQFLENTRLQLVKLIRQRRNFTSIFTWCIGNEIRSDTTGQLSTMLANLHELARAEDPLRPTVLATNKRNATLCNATDLHAINAYPGWYTDDIDAMAKIMADYNRTGKGRGLVVSEYGAGASIEQHELGMTRPPATKGRWHPEEWQSLVHERNYPAIAETDYCWGGFIWLMFDHASNRVEGYTPGLNNKGLVTYDRKTRKDAFYFYKANWSKEPVLYITSHRFTERKDPVTEVKVYTNATGEVTLTVNGHVIGTAKPNAWHICLWENVTLRPGKNEITVTARRDSQELRDTCVWTLVPNSK